jgi:hypothetical protein
MSSNQKQIQLFVAREIASLTWPYQPGPWLTEETAARFQTSAERAAVTYLEERALTAAVASVVGAANPATPFIVAGLKQILDAETPAAIRFLRTHPEAGVLGAGVLFLVWWKFAPAW